MSKDPKSKEDTLWCLPYDTESIFKPFLKISFSTYINQIISNQNYQAYQKVIAREIKDQFEWNDKCWAIITFFQFINASFEISEWDDHITFIEDNILRKTLAYFRLWIDTERLYLFNFLKLDSSEFQEDRIFMTFYRTLIIFHAFFSEYLLKDFEATFLENFIKNCVRYLGEISYISTNQTSELIQYIIRLLRNVKAKERILVQSIKLHQLRKNAIIKVAKENEIIKDVEARLKHTVKFQHKSNETNRIKVIAETSFIDDFTKSITKVYDPLFRLKEDYKTNNIDFDEKAEIKSKQWERHQKKMHQDIEQYKRTELQTHYNDSNPYQNLNDNFHNPYLQNNYSIYGEPLKTDMEKKKILQKSVETEVVKRVDNMEEKYFYDQKFTNYTKSVNSSVGRVTVKDLSLAMSNSKNNSYNEKDDENTKVFNLKWHAGSNSSERKKIDLNTAAYTKDYDNNLLFKTPLDDHIADRQKRAIEKIMQNKECKTYTIALLEKMGDEIHPAHINSSFGSNLFVKKETQILDLKQFKLLNQNKFDFMRKVIGFMTAQKKIKNILAEKNLPEFYTRNYEDIKEKCYNFDLVASKMNYVLERQSERPGIYI